jgi:hypothetical protein
MDRLNGSQPWTLTLEHQEARALAHASELMIDILGPGEAPALERAYARLDAALGGRMPRTREWQALSTYPMHRDAVGDWETGTEDALSEWIGRRLKDAPPDSAFAYELARLAEKLETRVRQR